MDGFSSPMPKPVNFWNFRPLQLRYRWFWFNGSSIIHKKKPLKDITFVENDLAFRGEEWGNKPSEMGDLIQVEDNSSVM